MDQPRSGSTTSITSTTLTASTARARARLLGINLLVLAGLLVVVEIGLQVLAAIKPSYHVLFLQPDRELGWKQVPKLEWRWGGHYWYAPDFSVDVKTNAQGFRDHDRATSKPAGTARVAFLGDSFIEAVQVPLEQTAGQMLERRLNAGAAGKAPSWEVLNFGVSNFGIGQYLLAWEHHASRYDADVVAIFVAEFHMRRAITKYETGAFSNKDKLWIRPTYRLDGDTLVAEPAQDFDTFRATQDELINTDFGADRSRRRWQVILLSFAKQAIGPVMALLPRRSSVVKPVADAADKHAMPSDADMIAINRKIIETLGRDVVRKGAKFVVLDVSAYFGDGRNVTDAIESVCAANGFGYVPVSGELIRARDGGAAVTWRHDFHFNVLGNQILADALLGWIKRNGQAM